jgi:hypothetical protein
MRTVKDRAYSLGQLVSCEQPVGLYNFALAVNPLGLHRVEPRALLEQQAAYDPHSTAAVLDSSVVRGDPPSYESGASSTNHTPSPKLPDSSAVPAKASRVLPEPPGRLA